MGEGLTDPGPVAWPPVSDVPVGVTDDCGAEAGAQPAREMVSARAAGIIQGICTRAAYRARSGG